MVIIFFKASENKLYICSEYEKTKVISASDPNIFAYIPDDDILYVESAHKVTKQQFCQWLSGNCQTPQKITRPKSIQKQYFIHPAHNGTVLIEDIKIPHTKHAQGIQLNGKWDFISVKEAGGQEVLEESMHFRTLLAKNKIEIVDEQYVIEHQHKKRDKKSPTESSLDAILVPVGIKAKEVEANGTDDVETILID